MSVCLATFAECSSQFWLNRLGRCLKLIATTRGTFCHEFASQFGLELFLYAKKLQTSHPLTDRPGRMLQCHQPSERRNLKGSLYGFTPGGDLRPQRLWMILLAPQNHPSLRKSYPRCNDPAKRGSVCEAFEKNPLPLALTRLLRYRYRPVLLGKSCER